jgi:hypothetical protein
MKVVSIVDVVYIVLVEAELMVLTDVVSNRVVE